MRLAIGVVMLLLGLGNGLRELSRVPPGTAAPVLVGLLTPSALIAIVGLYLLLKRKS